MPTPVKYGKMYVKDASGNLNQIILRTPMPAYQGATTSADGVQGMVPAATSADRNKYLKGDGTWSGAKDDLLSNYAKPTEASAVASSDSIESAIGKLEKSLDGKQETMSAISDARIDEMFG